MQALILAGGEGTRLRPLTSTMPKPIVPLVDRPFIVYMLEWLAEHGVDDVILCCGFMSDDVRHVLGDGSSLSLRLRYTEEPEPLGTGGALKFAEDLLDERFLMLNGDVLTDIDLTAQLTQHERSGALATLALVDVEDPTGYGLVRQNGDGSVREFIEKPAESDVDTNLISAGAYVLEHEVLEMMAPATNISIEREVFPKLIGRGLFGHATHGYWLDIGTPERYLKATFDILEGTVETHVPERLGESGLEIGSGAEVEGRLLAPTVVGPGCVIERDAVVGERTVLSDGVRVHEGARVHSSVVLDGSCVGARSTVSDSIIGPDVTIGEDCQIERDVVIGEGARIGPHNVLAAGARIFPGVELPEAALHS